MYKRFIKGKVTTMFKQEQIFEYKVLQISYQIEYFSKL